MNDRQEHLQKVLELRKTFADPCEGIIYHYTSAKGFHGIIESSEIWLTNTEFVNDVMECNALWQETDLFEKDEISFNRYVKKKWDSFSKHKIKHNNYYIASFSKEHDSLEQWRAYGNFCIGFEAQRLQKTGFSLYECVYSKEVIKKWLLDKAKAKEWMLDVPDRTRHFIADDGIPTTRYADGRDVAAFSLIFRASIKLKHHCYHNERDVRLMAVSNHDWGFYSNSPTMFEKDPPIYFRLHPSLQVPIPYVRFFVTCQDEEESDLSENHRNKTEHQIKEEKREEEKQQKRALLPIKEIWIGPTPHLEKTRISSEILLHEKGYKDVTINISEIPYRGF